MFDIMTNLALIIDVILGVVLALFGWIGVVYVAERMSVKTVSHEDLDKKTGAVLTTLDTFRQYLLVDILGGIREIDSEVGKLYRKQDAWRIEESHLRTLLDNIGIQIARQNQAMIEQMPGYGKRIYGIIAKYLRAALNAKDVDGRGEVLGVYVTGDDLRLLQGIAGELGYEAAPRRQPMFEDPETPIASSLGYELQDPHGPPETSKALEETLADRRHTHYGPAQAAWMKRDPMPDGAFTIRRGDYKGEMVDRRARGQRPGDGNNWTMRRNRYPDTEGKTRHDDT